MGQAVIRIVLADDHAVVRQGIRDFLEDEPDLQVVAEAADGAAAKTLIAEHRPDVAILDIRMPHASGIEIAATEGLLSGGVTNSATGGINRSAADSSNRGRRCRSDSPINRGT